MSNVGATPRYQVFLSSTYEDLRQERQQATQAILEMGHFPAGMELFPASDQTQADLIRKIIQESDYYVLILAGRYGSTDAAGMSYTEMEYDWAVEYGLPVLSFVKRSIDEIPSKWAEKDEGKRLRLEAFRNKVMSKHVRLFDSSAELGMHVMKSLMSESRVNPRIGWLRADHIPIGMDIEAETLLREELKAAKNQIKRFERAARDRQRDLPDISMAELASGSDLFVLNISCQDKQKQQQIKNVELTWDEIFGAIAPSMYGFIQRRFSSGYNQPEAYKFETDLIDVIRVKLISEIGSRSIRLFTHQIDTILIQFQQLGYIEYTEIERENDKDRFRGYTLTAQGETHLMKVRLLVRS